MTDEAALHEHVAAAPAKERSAYARAAILRGASEEVQASTEHRLRRFMPLLDPNPRAMKLLVTAYGVYVAYASASGVLDLDDEKRDEIALFTILSLRWPRLVEYLTDHPEKLDTLKRPAAPKVDRTGSDAEEERAAHELARLPAVNAVLTGKGIGRGLERSMLDVLIGYPVSAEPAASGGTAAKSGG